MNHAFDEREVRFVSKSELGHLLPLLLFFSKHQRPYLYNRNANSGYLKSYCIVRTNVCKSTASQFSVQWMNAKVIITTTMGLPFMES